MGASRVIVSEEIVCKRGVIICSYEEVGREVVSFMSERGGMLEESKSG